MEKIPAHPQTAFAFGPDRPDCVDTVAFTSGPQGRAQNRERNLPIWLGLILRMDRGSILILAVPPMRALVAGRQFLDLAGRTSAFFANSMSSLWIGIASGNRARTVISPD